MKNNKKTPKNAEIYDKYQHIIEDTNAIYKEGRIHDEKFLESINNIIDSYKRLDSHFKKVVKISDKNQAEILRMNEMLKTLTSEKETLIAELEQRNIEMSSLMKMKEDFFAVASHDLRSPFAAIIMSAKMLLSEEELSESHKNYIRIILDSAQIQLTYINDLLKIILSESKELKLNLMPVSVNKLLATSVTTLEILAKRKNIELVFQEEKTETDFYVLADFEKLIQVVNNLISNAVKFTYPGGKVEVFSKKTPENECEIHVTDSGLGIPFDKIKDLFIKYKKHHNSGTNGELGSGLGLFISKNIIEKHNGKIGANSVIDSGSDFWFSLPLIQNF